MKRHNYLSELDINQLKNYFDKKICRNEKECVHLIYQTKPNKMTQQQLLQAHIEQLIELIENKSKKPAYMVPAYDRAIEWTNEQIKLLSN